MKEMTNRRTYVKNSLIPAWHKRIQETGDTSLMKHIMELEDELSALTGKIRRAEQDFRVNSI